MKNYFILLVLLSGVTPLIAQYRLDTIVADFNNDKVIDTLIDEYESGSTFGGRSVTITNGKTNETFTLSNYGCYCNFKQIVPIPNALTLDANSAFFEVLKEKVLPKKRAQPDSSLEWMTSATFNLKQVKSHALFDRIISPKTNWQSKPPTIPETYYNTVFGDTLQKLSATIKDNLTASQTKGFLIYYTNAHAVKSWDSLTPVITNDRYQIYKTAHAVFARKGNTYKWMFLSDLNTTGAPEKLRWSSINQVQLIDNYLIIHQDTSPDASYSIYIVNIETQRMGRLKYEASHHNVTTDDGMRTFKIIDNQLVFTTYDKQDLVELSLQQIFDTLDN